jgi:hypothetical protein
LPQVFFFVYNESRITNSLQRFAKQHTTTLRSEAYLMGRLVKVIWGDDWDAKYFVNNSNKMSLGKLIHDMYDPNLETRIIVQHVVCTHWWGLHTIGLHLKNVIEGSHR